MGRIFELEVVVVLILESRMGTITTSINLASRSESGNHIQHIIMCTSIMDFSIRRVLYVKQEAKPACHSNMLVGDVLTVVGAGYSTGHQLFKLPK